MEAYRMSQNSFEETSTSSSSIIGEESWQHAEMLAMQILRQIEPTEASEKSRKEIVKYMQEIITPQLGCVVFSYGSFPFKAYLPDGDIDLTVLTNESNDAELAKKVLEILNNEEHNEGARYEVKDILFINAEVKIIKCRVQDLMVDISFNQLGGLRTLCFLSMVDNQIGRDHLFKKAVILIKAWCYYESRLLGGNHGLISTYGLEILIMYIFNIYHKSVDGPLQALYLFLDYYGKFDWDKYSVSLLGPVDSSSRQQAAVPAETSQQSGREAPLSEEFMKDCFHVLALNSMDQESTYQVFPTKCFNIVDPLRRENNVGRSVSKGNLFRISCAFSYGARKLGEILGQPPRPMAEELNKYFTNTLERCGRGMRPDVTSAHRSDPMVAEESRSRMDSVAWALETMVAISEAEADAVASRATGAQATSNTGDRVDRPEAAFTTVHLTEEDVDTMVGQLRVLLGSGSSSVGADEVKEQFQEYCHDVTGRRRSSQKPEALMSPAGEEAETIPKEGSTPEVEALLRMVCGEEPSPNARRERPDAAGKPATEPSSGQRSTPTARNAEGESRPFELNDDEFPPLPLRGRR